VLDGIYDMTNFYPPDKLPQMNSNQPPESGTNDKNSKSTRLTATLRSTMPPILLRAFVILLLGLSAPFWWTFIGSNMIKGIFHLAYGPERPTKLLVYSTILVPNIIIGLLAGYALALLSADSFLKGWGLFFVAFISVGLIAGQSFASFLYVFSSPGTIAFLLATTAFPLFMALHSRTNINV
jgi:hypothetical protein